MNDEQHIIPWALMIALIVLVCLKAAGIIGWSWWWVTLPAWGPAIPLTFYTLWAEGNRRDDA